MQDRAPRLDEAGCRRRRYPGRVAATIACAIALTAVLGCDPRPAPQSYPTTPPAWTFRPAPQSSPTTPPAWTFRPALQFSPATLPDAQVGASYAATITVSQTATPVGGASIKDGALPAGLTLALAKQPMNTIQISGTPTVSGTFNFTIYVWCYGTNVSGQTATQAYTLAVK